MSLKEAFKKTVFYNWNYILATLFAIMGIVFHDGSADTYIAAMLIISTILDSKKGE